MEKKEFLDNTRLRELMNLLQKENMNQIEKKFFEQLLKSQFLLPVIVKAEDKISLIKITDENEKEYLPVFTDMENFQLSFDSSSETHTVIFAFEEYYEIVQSDLNISGVVINPYSENLVLTRENLQFIENSRMSIKNGESVSIGLPKDYPFLLVEKCKDFFKSDNSVKSAYLLQMVKENQLSLLLVIETVNIERVFPKLSMYLEKYLDSDKILDMIPLDTDFGKNVTKDYEPFFER